MTDRKIVLRLTAEQQALLKADTGEQAETIELQVEQLEDRIVPGGWGIKAISRGG
jgi:hypothetical protein